jgi:hypothetical protein
LYPIVINSTTTIYIASGGAGLTSSNTVGNDGLPNTGAGGDGNSMGGSGLVVLYT